MIFTKRTHTQTMSSSSLTKTKPDGNSLTRPSTLKRLATVRRPAILFALALTVGASLPCLTLGQQYDSKFYAGMRWRQIGPFRAGRVSAVAGVPGNPSVFYMATPGGGIWKTTDGGTVWKPISDQVPVASIGAMAVAQSDTKVIYVGTGDVSNVGGAANVGDGVYKSVDGGASWQHVGLEGTEKIGALWVDPKNPDVVVVAALGQTFAQNAERGIFKTNDGGRSWRKVLYKDDVTGAVDVAFAPDDSRVGFATLWGHYVKPGDPGAVLNGSNGGAIYKTTDGGDTWTQVGVAGLPTGNLGRIGVAVAPGGRRVHAIIAAQRDGGLYRSDDGGATWQRSTTDRRIQGSGYFSKVFLDPHDPDIVYVAQTSLYRSTDGGHNFIAYKGAPGGDDNHVLWIDPTNSDWMILGSDQGATISMNGGRSWSSWYNQPTGQIYHLSTDNRFPYWVYGTQQDSGSVGTLSRGDYGAITFMDWDPVGGYEFGYIIADALDPNLVYAGGPGRGLVRIDRTNRQVATVSPNVSREGDYRTAVNPPLAFSPQNPRVLYEATQFLLETSDGGMTWKAISPDLTKRPGSEAAQQKVVEERAKEANDKKPKTKEEAATIAPPDRTSINTFSPSPVQAGVIWAGTTDGLIQLTKDGGATWKEVSPPGLTRWSLVSIVEASRFDAGTAYAAVDNHESNDFRPHVFRTHDFGATWQEVVSGIPDGSFARVVREDPARKGLLYAGTENGAFVSFDEGGHWNSLQLNLPTVSVRDLAVHGDDLVAATYGRAFWILDDLAPLRQLGGEVAKSEAFLFQPAKAIRVRLNSNADTPLPPEMPAGENPPAGALLDYYLKSEPKEEVTLAVYDRSGQLIRQFSSRPEPPSTEPPPDVPDYWLWRPKPLPKHAGMNRFVWDLRYAAPPALRHSYPISALYENTPPEPQGPLVPPGEYEARLTVNGRTYRRTVTVVEDPRVKTPASALAEQLALEQRIVRASALSFEMHRRAAELRAEIAEREKSLGAGGGTDGDAGATEAMLKEFDQKVANLEGDDARGGFGKPKPTFAVLNGLFGDLSVTVGGADIAPTEAMRTAYGDYCGALSATLAQWSALVGQDLRNVNAELSKRHLAPLTASTSSLPELPCK